RVVEVEADSVAALEPGVLQRAREPQRVAGELSVGPAPVFVDDRILVRERGRRSEQAVVDEPLRRLRHQTASATNSGRTTSPTTTRVGVKGSASTGRATSLSCKSMIEIAPTSAISSVSLTPPPGRSNFATTRSTALGSRIPAASTDCRRSSSPTYSGRFE